MVKEGKDHHLKGHIKKQDDVKFVLLFTSNDHKIQSCCGFKSLLVIIQHYCILTEGLCAPAKQLPLK